MKRDGIWVDRESKEPKIHSPRKPRDRRGELVQVDGSYHRWFEKRGNECCLLVFIDDATSELKILRFVEHESSYNYMACLKSYIEEFGCPLALFSDRHSIFRATNPTAIGVRTLTQFSRACSRLYIKVICAETPQAKGRVERANRTLQDQLVKELKLNILHSFALTPQTKGRVERTNRVLQDRMVKAMRLAGVRTIEEANAFASEYVKQHNKRFAKPPRQEDNHHRSTADYDLDGAFSQVQMRRVTKQLTFSFDGQEYRIKGTVEDLLAIGPYVKVEVRLNGTMAVFGLNGQLTFHLAR